MGLFGGTVWDCLRQFGAVLDLFRERLGQFGYLFGAVWVPVWDCLVLFGTVLGACLGLLGTPWESFG